MFFCLHGYSQVYMAESVSSISQFLTDGGAGPTLQISYIERKLDSDRICPSLPTITNPIQASMAIDVEDPPVPSPSQLDGSSSDVDEMLRGLVAPVLAALEFDIDDDAITELMFNTMRTNFHPGRGSPPGPCDVCNGRHDADACRVRGAAFLPEWLLKNVKQYNNKYGDKPKVPPPNIPPPPQKPKFGP